jgi:hypothetical protein
MTMGRTATGWDNELAAPAPAAPGRGHELQREVVGVVDDQLNVPLEDAELLAEVELTTNLIIAASESDDSLPQAEVDRLLGLHEESADDEAGRIPFQKARYSA